MMETKQEQHLDQSARDFLDLLDLPARASARENKQSDPPEADDKAVAKGSSLPVRMVVNRRTWLTSPFSFVWSAKRGSKGQGQTIVLLVYAILEAVMDQLYVGLVTYEAAFHLFWRLFAPVILVVSLVLLVLLAPSTNGDITSFNATTVAFTLAILSSATIATDTMYIQEFGKVYVLGLYGVVLAVSTSSCSCVQRDPSFWTFGLQVPTTALVVCHSLSCDHTLPTDSLKPGFYHNKLNPTIAKIVQQWPAEHRVYRNPSPWVVNGDTRTGIPFFINHVPTQPYVRRYVPSVMNMPMVTSTTVGAQKEHVILDIAFPSDGIHRQDKTIYFVLCGLVGGSQEGYVKELVASQRAAGHTVAVMVTRGFKDSVVMGSDLFCFCDSSDAQAALSVLRHAAAPHQMIAGVGFSMGGILLANYVARSGTNCILDAAVSISGALDTRKQIYFERSKRFWQPLLVKDLKDLTTGKFMKQLQARFTRTQLRELQRTTTVTGFDGTYAVRYHGFRDIFHYYSELGGMGDHMIELNDDDGNTSEVFREDEVGRIGNASIPLLMLNALDDPIGEPRANPSIVTQTGSGCVLLLRTEKGGHVGWPQGWNPRAHGWKWMINVASTFIDSVGDVCCEPCTTKQLQQRRPEPHLIPEYK